MKKLFKKSRKQFYTHKFSPGFFELKTENNGVTTVYKLDDNLERMPMKKLIGKGLHANVDGSTAFDVAIIRTFNLVPYFKN